MTVNELIEVLEKIEQLGNYEMEVYGQYGTKIKAIEIRMEEYYSASTDKKETMVSVFLK